jgi:predicted phosphodiesterase
MLTIKFRLFNLRRASSCGLFIVCCGSAWAADPVWLELAPGNRVLARTVASAACPSITLDGKVFAMTPRLAADSPGKATPPNQRLVCETEVTGAGAVAINGIALRMPPKNPQRIVVLGDTGCRIKVESDAAPATDADQDDAKGKVQDCNDKKLWPFEAVAAAAAVSKPDLVIHVGDYIYRESPCPIDSSGDCGGSPNGDKWATWDADFFKPARPLLEAAPWIFVRGNHEICKRAGKGWYYYLSPGAYTSNDQCTDQAAPFAVKLGDFQAWVLDSSSAPDAGPTAAQVGQFTSIFQQGISANLSHAWLVSHRPVWAAKAGTKGDRGELRTLNETLQKAWAAAPMAGVDFIVAGHTHLFELLSFKQPLPPQAVIGNGGTDLAHQIKAKLAGQTIGTATVANGDTVDDFGYALIEPRGKGDGWSLKLHDSKGNKTLTCTIAKGATNCGSK